MMDTNNLINELIKQKIRNEKGSIYHWSQVNFAYNSNKIEGSRLTEDQTEQIFETNSLFQHEDDYINVDDVIETINHFRLFDYMLDTLSEPLDKSMMIQMNVILKKGTSYEYDKKYNVGGFKLNANFIGVFNQFVTTQPQDVEQEINELLEWYNSKEQKTLKDIIHFHVIFERIHPFGDGNGRTGRMIMFRECMLNDICPFIILDIHKPYYMRGLKKYDEDKTFLVETCLNEQDIYYSVCNQLGIEVGQIEECENDNLQEHEEQD